MPHCPAEPAFDIGACAHYLQALHKNSIDNRCCNPCTHLLLVLFHWNRALHTHRTISSSILLQLSYSIFRRVELEFLRFFLPSPSLFSWMATVVEFIPTEFVRNNYVNPTHREVYDFWMKFSWKNKLIVRLNTTLDLVWLCNPFVWTWKPSLYARWFINEHWTCSF